MSQPPRNETAASDANKHRAVRIHRFSGEDPFDDGRSGWWGYRVFVPDCSPFDCWILGADYIEIGEGFIQREAVSERLADGRSPFECDDPHPDSYYDILWDHVLADLHRSGHPSLA